jgi:phospholipid transport system substrate-binding protein
MTLHRRGFALAVVVLAAAVLVSPAWAGTPTEQLKSQIDRVLKVLDDPDLKKENRARDRRASVRQIANDIFDFSETAKRSLARHWQSRTPAEREEFVQLFGDLLERSYISKIELYGGEKIGYIGESMDGDLATVRTRIVTRHGTEIPIDYKMHTLGSRWLVYDVSIEGVSLIANYRTQFNKIIQTQSYAELVKRMKTKQEEFLEEEKQRRTSQK